jgi:hypothetical protein
MSCCVAAARTTDDRQITFLKKTVISRYHHDRAMRIASLLPEKPDPVLLEQIPQTLISGSTTYSADVTDLTRRVPGPMPVEALARVTQCIAADPPDELKHVEYRAQQARKYDPLIYAQYGEWCVQLAQWD